MAWSRVLIKLVSNYKSIAYMLLSLNIVLLSFIIIIQKQINHEMVDGETGIRMCVPCTAIILHPDDVPSWVAMDRANSSKCCIEDQAKIGILINYLVDNWSRKAWSKDNIVKWNSKHEMSFSHKFRYEDGFIRVDVTGFYHVYSLVTVRVKGDLQPSVSHALFLQEAMEEYGKETMLAKSDDKPKCLIDHAKASDREIMYPSRIDIVVPLTKGDRFYVKLINVVEIMTDPAKTFIGAYMVSV